MSSFERIDDLLKESIKEVHHLVRLYRSSRYDQETGTTKNYSPFFFSHGADRRLSSDKFGIKVGYWAPRIEPCFLEVFLRREEGEFMAKAPEEVTLRQQELYKVCKIILPDHRPLKLFSAAESKDLCSSAVYSNGEEKDNFVKAVYDSDQNFDGIEYRSNHNADHLCYAIFERSVDRINNTTLDLKIKDQTLASNPRDLLQIIDAFDSVTFEGLDT